MIHLVFAPPYQQSTKQNESNGVFQRHNNRSTITGESTWQNMNGQSVYPLVMKY